MNPINGRALAAEIASEVAASAAELRTAGVKPSLAIVIPGEDPAAEWYVKAIAGTSARTGVECRTERLACPDTGRLSAKLQELSEDRSVHGIICQAPLPTAVSADEALAHIAPEKDIDCANPLNLGRLMTLGSAFAPATAAASVEILRREKVLFQGTRAVVVGRSAVVGKPTAMLLLAENATVTICHSHTRDLAGICSEADILVAAAGQPHLITPKHVKPGAVVIDVGTSPGAAGTMVGDVNAEALTSVPGKFTPVPGGVGPVTTITLLAHTVAAARAAAGCP